VVSVWIVCQHRNEPRSISSLKTSASQSTLSGQINPDEVQINEQAMDTAHLRHRRDGWNSSEVTINDYYRQHGATTFQTLSSNICWIKSTQMNRTLCNQILNLEKTRLKINNKPRSGSNLHQLHLPVNKQNKRNSSNRATQSHRHINETTTQQNEQKTKAKTNPSDTTWTSNLPTLKIRRHTTKKSPTHKDNHQPTGVEKPSNMIKGKPYQEPSTSRNWIPLTKTRSHKRQRNEEDRYWRSTTQTKRNLQNQI